MLSAKEQILLKVEQRKSLRKIKTGVGARTEAYGTLELSLNSSDGVPFITTHIVRYLIKHEINRLE